jgi:predicted transcriptional regulator with HTH domain
LKNITVKSITYGNYESRVGNEAPLIDLTSFSVLQDWTNAAQTFKKSGRTDDIINLLSENNVEEINKLSDFTDDIITNRGVEILNGLKVSELKKQIKKYNPQIPPYNEIKSEINKSLKPFKQGSVDNGFKAVEFCIDHGLIQQGVTLLQEFIVSKVMYLAGITKPENLKSKKARNVFTVALQKQKKEDIKPEYFLNDAEKKSERKKDKALKKIKTWLDEIFAFSFKERLTNEIFIELADNIRNDINHAGFRAKPMDAQEFRVFLEKKLLIVTEIFGLK